MSLRMSLKKLFLLSPLGFLINTAAVSAHCPLCTMGAVAVAGGAAYFGVSSIIIGLFIGAFAASLGLWIARVVKKQYFRYQKQAIFAVIFLSTVLPTLPLIPGMPYPLYISWFGEYGSAFNRTYLFNLFLVGSMVGGFVMSVMPWVSARIAAAHRGKLLFPYQGIVLTLVVLVVIGGVLQLLLI